MEGSKLKRKRVLLTIHDKIKIIERLDKGEKCVNIATEYGISKQQVSDIKKKKDKLLNHATSVEDETALKKRKTLKTPKNEKLEEATYLWFSQQRAKGAPVSGPMLQEKAIQFNENLQSDEIENNFKASSGWLKRFKDRHSIREVKLQGEKMSADPTQVQPYVDKLRKIMDKHGLVDEQVYNADETGLYWKILPDKTLASTHGREAAGHKIIKDRVTLLGCANATGTHKLEPLLIGKYANPRCFKHVNMKSLPVIYRNQRNAWMDSELFTDWFMNSFVPAVRKHLRKQKLPVKALLLIDNCTAHPTGLKSRDGKIRCEFLPPNMTSLLQPFDHGILEGLKKRYRKQLLRRILTVDDSDKSVMDILKSVTLKDVVYMIADAWDNATSDSIAKSFNATLSIGIQQPEENEENEDDETDDGADNDSVASDDELTDSEWNVCDNDIETAQNFDDDAIIDFVSCEKRGADSVDIDCDDQDCDDPIDDESDLKVTNSEAVEHLRKSIYWLERQSDAEPVQLLTLNRLLSYASAKKHGSEKQTKVSDFFKPS